MFFNIFLKETAKFQKLIGWLVLSSQFPVPSILLKINTLTFF